LLSFRSLLISGFELQQTHISVCKHGGGEGRRIIILLAALRFVLAAPPLFTILLADGSYICLWFNLMQFPKMEWDILVYHSATMITTLKITNI
jgi:hypothetical protein